MKPWPVALVLLAVATFALGSAWQLQATAAADLARARDLQDVEVPDPGGEPPRPGENRRILESLRDSIDIRRDIEGTLQRVEAAVRSLSIRQAESALTSESARRELGRIATALGGAVDAAGVSVSTLGTLHGRLHKSARLARLIAEELEELDRRLGPTVPR
jgi:hypothetical protein